MPEAQITKAHADRNEVPALCRMLAKDHLFIMASWTDPNSHKITVHDFIKNARSFIRIFSDRAHFITESKGSGFENKVVSIDFNLFVSMLRGDELLILNPGRQSPVELRKADLMPHAKPFVAETRPSKSE